MKQGEITGNRWAQSGINTRYQGGLGTREDRTGRTWLPASCFYFCFLPTPYQWYLCVGGCSHSAGDKGFSNSAAACGWGVAGVLLPGHPHSSPASSVPLTTASFHILGCRHCRGPDKPVCSFSTIRSLSHPYFSLSLSKTTLHLFCSDVFHPSKKKSLLPSDLKHNKTKY